MKSMGRQIAAALVVIGLASPAFAQAPSCPTGYTARFTVQNNCSTDVWMVETAPGLPLTQPAVLGQWAWFNQYATQFGSIGIGTGSISSGSRALSWSVPGTIPAAGVTITVQGAGPSGAPLTTTIVKDSASGATLATHASTTVTNAAVSAFSGQAALLLPAGPSQTFCVPDKGAPGGNFRFFMDCPNGNTDPFNSAGCTIGAASGALAGINTLFEPTFGCSPSLSASQCAFNPGDSSAACQSTPNRQHCSALASEDNVDISAVNGYTMPMSVTVSATCNRPSTDASMLDLASCPAETSATLYSSDSTQQATIDQGISLLVKDATSGNLKACVAPFNWFITSTLGTPTNPDPSDPSCAAITSSCFYAGAGCNTSEPETQCPGGSGPQQKVGPQANGQFAIQNTNWVQNLFALGYGGYTWQYGDGVGDQSCSWGGTAALTLCPNGGTPYNPSVLWTFSSTTGACSANGTGTPDGITTFGSLIACQQATMLYACQDLTLTDPFGIASAMWNADPTATLDGTGSTYAEVQAQRPGALTCSTLTVQNIPAGAYGNPGGTMQLPECNYLYGPDGAPCPGSSVSPYPVKFRVVGRGKAKHVGVPRKGDVLLHGTFEAPRAIHLAEATLHLWRLLREVGGVELTRDSAEKSLLPLTLTALPGSRGRAATYQSHNHGGQPDIVIKVSRPDRHTHRMEFAISVSHALISEPGLCSGDAPTTTILETRLTLHDGNGPPVQADAKLTWDCRKNKLVTAK